MNSRKFLFLLAVGALGLGWGCKNNTTTAPSADHPLDFVVGGDIGPGKNEFSAPMGLCVDGSDNLYVADYGNSRIKQYDSNGACQAVWGGPATVATVAAALNHPWGLALDSAGNILEVDHDTEQIQEFTTAGALVAQYGSFNVATWNAAGPGGVNMVSDDTGVHLFNGSGANGILATPGGSAFGHYALDPSGLAYDAKGDIYVGDLGNHRIDVYDSTGTPVSIWGAGRFSSIAGMALDRSSNLLVADAGSRLIFKFDKFGNFVESWMPDTVAQPMDVAVDSTGAIWVSFQDVSQAFLAKFAH
ncbi:MAG TPA: NHL repeat-containing protein [bacterium]|nr:NHL repeat-containing protein [bacterium]